MDLALIAWMKSLRDATGAAFEFPQPNDVNAAPAAARTARSLRFGAAPLVARLLLSAEYLDRKSDV